MRPGVRTYTAKVTFDGKDYTDTKTETLPALGHDYKDGKCSRCGAEEPTTPVEPGKPATGDSSTLVLWLALLAVSGMAVTVIPSRKKRSR